MTKPDFKKMQSCVLRVSIHCDGCKQKVKKMVQKVDGVYSTSIDAEQGKVIVIGNVDPATIIYKLLKSGKHAELWGVQKTSNNLMNSIHMFKNLQVGDGKNGDVHMKFPNGGNGQQKTFQQQKQQRQEAHLQQVMQQNVGRHKDHKSVKFDFGDGDEFDNGDEEFEDQILHKKMKGNMSNGRGHLGPNGSNGMVNIGKVKSEGNGKKGGEFEIPLQIKGKSSRKKDGKKKKNGGKKMVGFGFPMLFKRLIGIKVAKGAKKAGKYGRKGTKVGEHKNKGGACGKNRGENGGRVKGEVKFSGGGKKKGADNGSRPGGDGHCTWDINIRGAGNNDIFQEVDMSHNRGAGGWNMRQKSNYPLVEMCTNPMGQMDGYPMGQMSTILAAQGLPAGAMTNGYYQGMEQGNLNNQLQQQYMAAMMMNQHAAYGAEMFSPIMYGRPQPVEAYGPPMQPWMNDNFTHSFSDENSNSCNIM